MTKVQEVPSETLNESGVLREMIEYKREVLKRIQQDVVREQSILAEIRQQIKIAQGEVQAAQAFEREQFLKGLDAERLSLKGEQQRLEALDLEVNSRLKEVRQLEEQASPIQVAQQALIDERLAIEQQRMRLEELRQETDRLANGIGSLQEEAAQLKAVNVVEVARLHVQAQEAETQERQLNAREQSIATQAENLESLKLVIDPKLAEMTKLQERGEHDLHQAEVIMASVQSKQAELDQQRSDLAILSSRLEAKAAALTDFDASLKHTASELQIKIQQAKIKDVTLPEAPV